ncbi:TPA: ATP-binding protein [Legionella pneumophila]|nr:ATP-binding protein [Legionella pneumophila]
MKNRIADINWDNFRTKFSEDKQSAFERLCYLLFCKEFDKNIGIFRFKNQAGIETNPIEKDGFFIGWQAKFYDTGLSKNKADLIGSIETTKQRHPEVNKIIFYTNQEFGQPAKSTVPRYKTDIEKYAKTNNIDIEWRAASYFESPFVCEQFNVVEHFFSLKKGILDSIAQIRLNTDSILKPIQSEIFFDQKKIKFDRSKILKQIKDIFQTSPLIIVYGGTGVGKTAVIKEYYENVKESVPFFLFKAALFKNITHINEFFKAYGEITSSEFISEHKDIPEKYIIFDSAEKFLEVEDKNVFQLFLTELVENDWKIIFTIRHSYLDDLRFQLEEYCGANFRSLNIPFLTHEELTKIAETKGFNLPKNARLMGLLQTPLYLNEYLKNYSLLKNDINYSGFKNIIWLKHIQNSSYQQNNIHRRREECFLSIAKQRACGGGFLVKINEPDNEALKKLEEDEIIKFESNAGGYFITHDVYEEWALEKLINRAFCAFPDYECFYNDIGDSLAIRRSFRNWFSDKLFDNDENAKQLIEFTVQNIHIHNHWRDEVIVSVLLSNYSKIFFEQFENELLIEPNPTDEYDKFDQDILYKVIFLLRIACKTVDEGSLKQMGFSRKDYIALETIFTIPKGSGWSTTINFINKHKEKIKLRNRDIIISMLEDWNRSYKTGKTTKNASQCALFYYEESISEYGSDYTLRSELGKKILRTILNGAGEIKEELAKIIEEAISTKNNTNKSKYDELVKTILSSIINSSEVAKNIPEEVLKLADYFWFAAPNKIPSSYAQLSDIETCCGLKTCYQEYYPSSAFQTPVLLLLQTASKATIDFILSFTNRTIEHFAKSRFSYEVGEIDVIIDDAGQSVKQYIGHKIWNIYRGTQSMPNILESIHMALERWLLTLSKEASSEELENLCLYLLKNSKSTSITAIIVSVVLANPIKMFNVAKILFQTEDFFFFDLSRMQLDMNAKGLYSMYHDPIGIFKNERLETCNQKHRGFSLENQAFSYQFRSHDEKEEETIRRQEVLWKIFDKYYAKLPPLSNETDYDKPWRLCLARMDMRKMEISTESKGDQTIITFNPKLNPVLSQYSEDALTNISENNKYLSLQLWARYKFENNNEAKNYPQYENDHKLTISKTKEVLEQLKKYNIDDRPLVYVERQIPAYACSVLLRDYSNQLSIQDAEFCKEIILEYSSMPLRENYKYQFNDGLDVAISSLPLLLKQFPKDREKIKEILLLLLFDSQTVGNQKVSDYATSAILELWNEYSHDANALLYGYLLLKPKFDNISKLIRKKNKVKIKHTSIISLIDFFKKKHAEEIQQFISNQLTYRDIENVSAILPATLMTAFLLIPLKTPDSNHKKFLANIIPVLIATMRTEDRNRCRNHSLEQKFFNKFAHFVLTSEKTEIESYILPFAELISDRPAREMVTNLLNELVCAEDVLSQYDEFWVIWQIFYPHIVKLCSNENIHRDNRAIIHNYLLVFQWKTGTKKWHSLKDRERTFFKKVSNDIGNNSVVLYSIAKLLNDIGSNFASDGISWISSIIQRNPDLYRKELEEDTVYYLENFVRSYILKNRQNIKITLQLKTQILVILNFLLKKASVTAYLLREDIL